MDNKTKKRAAVSRRKKIDKTSAVNFGVIFCTVFSLIYVVGLLLVASFAGGSRAGLASISAPFQRAVCSQISKDNNASATPEMIFPAAYNGAGVDDVITVDDGGYNQKLVTVSIKNSRALEISNQGVNPHSFVIRDLNIDSGPIAPGSSKIVVLEGMGSDIRNYDFYSNIGRDDTFLFGGVVEAVE